MKKDYEENRTHQLQFDIQGVDFTIHAGDNMDVSPLLILPFQLTKTRNASNHRLGDPLTSQWPAQ